MDFKDFLRALTREVPATPSTSGIRELDPDEEMELSSCTPDTEIVAAWREDMISRADKLHAEARLNGDRTILEDSIQIQQEVLNNTVPDHPERLATLRMLAESLDCLSQITGELAPLKEAIYWQTEAICMRPLSQADRADVLRNLVSSLGRRHKMTEDIKSHDGEAMDTEPETPTKFLKGAHLGKANKRDDGRFYAHDGEDVLPWDQTRRDAMITLAHDLHEHACQSEDRASLEASLQVQQDVLARTPPNHPERVTTLRARCVSLDWWCHMTGDISALDEAICHEKEILSTCPPGHPGRVETLDNIGSLLRHRSEKTQDANMSYTQFSKGKGTAVLSTEPEILAALSEFDGPNKPIGAAVYNSNIAAIEQAAKKSNWTENMLSLMQGLQNQPNSSQGSSSSGPGIRKEREAPQGSCADQPEVIKMCASLEQWCQMAKNVISFTEALYDQTEGPWTHPDAESETTAAQSGSEALEPENLSRTDNQAQDAEVAESATWDPVERRAMISFAKDLHERACLLDDTTLLEESLRIQKDVLDRTPPDHPERAMVLTRLAVSLDRQFLTTGDSASLFDAIIWLKEATSLCPPGHPGHGYVRRNLAKSLCRWVEATEDGSSLGEALHMAQEEYAVAIQKVENSENIGENAEPFHIYQQMHQSQAV